MKVLEELKVLETKALEDIHNALSLDTLETLRVSITGKKGVLTGVLRNMKEVDPKDRPLIGKYANEVRARLELALEERKGLLAAKELEERICAQAVDVTLPGRTQPLGSSHLITQIVEEIEDIFCGLGYTVETGPYAETTYYNFTALNAPEDHPSRSARDTFYLKDPTKPADFEYPKKESGLLLRTQTSGVQIHTMESQTPPIYMIAPGTVFRPDTADANHLPQFTQIEGLVVDEGITFADLKGTLDYFCKKMFGAHRKTRYRPHFFPFTEPSCEVDVSCNICNGAGCRFCKGTGWLEILGCGMVDPNVFAYCNIDSEKYSGFAFGIGAERVAALRYDLPDLRMLVTGDMRFLKQF